MVQFGEARLRERLEDLTAGILAGEEFTELTDRCENLMDDVTEDATVAGSRRYRDLFFTSAGYGYRFWDAAWNQETWKV